MEPFEPLSLHVCVCVKECVCEVDRFLGLFPPELEVLNDRRQKLVRGLFCWWCVTGGGIPLLQEMLLPTVDFS